MGRFLLSHIGYFLLGVYTYGMNTLRRLIMTIYVLANVIVPSAQALASGQMADQMSAQMAEQNEKSVEHTMPHASHGDQPVYQDAASHGDHNCCAESAEAEARCLCDTNCSSSSVAIIGSFNSAAQPLHFFAVPHLLSFQSEEISQLLRPPQITI